MSLLIVDSAIQYSIFRIITSIITAVMTSAQTRYKDEMLVLHKMIKKSLVFRESGFSILPLNLNASNNVSLLADLPLKATKKWN